METKSPTDLAATMPAEVFFGTSSWTYPGWKGSIYKQTYASEAKFRLESLREYCAYPLFRTVGIDSFFYTPPTVEKLISYAALVPDSFRWIQKVWEHITIPVFPAHKRYGKFANCTNENFLNANLFQEKVLKPNCDTIVAKHCGPFVFQFPSINKQVLTQEIFLEKLDAFLTTIAGDQKYAVEVRNPEYLTNDYFSVLNSHKVTHCFNHWNYMPPLIEQMKAAARAGGLEADFYLARLLTPRGMNYQQAVEKFSPYNVMVEPNETMRTDVERLIRRAIKRSVSAYVIVNNRAEGHAPGTIAAIAGRLSS